MMRLLLLQKKMKSFLKSSNFYHRGSILILGFLFIFGKEACSLGLSTDSISFYKTNLSSIDATIKICSFKSTIAFSTPQLFDTSTNRLEIRVTEFHNYTTRSLIDYIPKSIGIHQLPDISLSTHHLILQDFESLGLFVFKIINNTFEYQGQIQLPEKCQILNAYPLDEKRFLLTDIYNHHPLDSEYNVSLCIYDATLDSITAEIHPVIPCIALSHLEHQWTSFDANFIFLAEPCGNKIHRFDHNLKNEKIIEFKEPSNWTNLSNNKIPFETSPDKVHPKIVIFKLIDLLPSFNRIETIKTINDSITEIICSTSDSNNIQNKQAIFYNSKQDVFTNHFQSYSTDIFGNSRNSIAEQLFNLSKSNWIGENKCITLSDDSFLGNPTLSQKENETNKEIYYQTKDPEFEFKIYNLNLSRIISDK